MLTNQVFYSKITTAQIIFGKLGESRGRKAKKLKLICYAGQAAIETKPLGYLFWLQLS